jgi:hypothetical protein
MTRNSDSSTIARCNIGHFEHCIRKFLPDDEWPGVIVSTHISYCDKSDRLNGVLTIYLQFLRAGE